MSWYFGTAQLVQGYGITNQRGSADRQAAFSLLETAVDVGVAGFDTAQKYGAAETTIGEFARAHGITSDVVTKIPEPDSDDTQSFVEACIRLIADCRQRLGPARLRAVLFHDPELAVRRKNDVRELDHAVRSRFPGLAVGASVYEPQQIIDDAWGGRAACYQVPANVFDRRFLTMQWGRNQWLMLRSVFLQGLLVQHLSQLPSVAHGHAALLSRYHRVVANSGVRPITAAVAAVLHFRPRDTLVVGAETPDQVRDIAAAFSEAQTIAPTTVQSLVTAGADAPADLIDPRTWL